MVVVINLFINIFARGIAFITFMFVMQESGSFEKKHNATVLFVRSFQKLS